MSACSPILPHLPWVCCAAVWLIVAVLSVGHLVAVILFPVMGNVVAPPASTWWQRGSWTMVGAMEKVMVVVMVMEVTISHGVGHSIVMVIAIKLVTWVR